MDVELTSMSLSFMALIAVAAAALVAFVLNLGSERVVRASELDSPPQVVNTGSVALVAVAVAVPLAALLAMVGTPFLGFLGVLIGVVLALGWRRAQLRRWRGEMVQDAQGVVLLLITRMCGGGDSLYNGLCAAIAGGRWRRLGGIAEKYILSQTATGTRFEEALTITARSRLLRDVPVVRSIFERLADLSARDVPLSNMIDSLTIMDDQMTDMVEMQQDQEAAAAVTRGNAYAVTGLTFVMGGMVMGVAHTLGEVLLHTIPGNITLVTISVMVITALFIADLTSDDQPLKF